MTFTKITIIAFFLWSFPYWYLPKSNPLLLFLAFLMAWICSLFEANGCYWTAVTLASFPLWFSYLAVLLKFPIPPGFEVYIPI